MANNFVGGYVAVYSPSSRRFFQVNEQLNVCLLDEQLNANQLGGWRSWERFFISDAGDGYVALYHSHFRRFVRILENGDVETGGERIDETDIDLNELSLITIKELGNGQVAFHNPNHNRFIRIHNGSVDAKGGVRDVNQEPGELERFQIVPHPLPS